MRFQTRSHLIAELSLRTTWHVTRHAARDKRSMCCTWFAHKCTWATWAYVLETVRGAVRRLLKKSQIVPLNAIIIIIIITIFMCTDPEEHTVITVLSYAHVEISTLW